MKSTTSEGRSTFNTNDGSTCFRNIVADAADLQVVDIIHVAGACHEIITVIMSGLMASQ